MKLPLQNPKLLTTKQLVQRALGVLALAVGVFATVYFNNRLQGRIINGVDAPGLVGASAMIAFAIRDFWVLFKRAISRVVK